MDRIAQHGKNIPQTGLYFQSSERYQNQRINIDDRIRNHYKDRFLITILFERYSYGTNQKNVKPKA